jgi:tetratricopeptide (TPR) repeat protein
MVLITFSRVGGRVLAMNYGQIQLAQCAFGRAKGDLQTVATTLAERQAQCPRSLAAALVYDLRNQEVVRLLEDTSSGCQGDPIATFFLGRAYEGLRQHGRAVEAWRHAGAGPYFIAAGRRSLEAGRAADASAAYGTALDIDPTAVDVYLGLGRANLQSGQTQEAILALSQGLSLDDRNSELHYWLARSYQERQEPAKAIQHVQIALQLNPALLLAYDLMGDVYYRQGAYAQAIASYQAGLEQAPRSVSLLTDLGRAAVTAEDYERALSWLGQALALDPDFKEAHYWAGRAQHGLGKPSLAIAEIETAIRLAVPGDKSAFYYWLSLGDIYAEIGEAQRASAAYERALAFGLQEQEVRKRIEKLGLNSR